MNLDDMLNQYRVLHQLTHDHEGWLQHPYGIDLWVDGLNVFLTVGEEDFLQALNDFLDQHSAATTSKMGCLRLLQTFCREAAAAGEFELYQALSVGMTWLSMHMEWKNPFFNLPLQITDHSTALLLSPTYLAMWAHSYNAGLTLYTDLNTDKITLFRPEHGRVCENGRAHQVHTMNFQYSSYFHEMAHIYFFHDVYSRVIGENAAEDISYFVHVEGICSILGDNILAELVAVRDDLTTIEDGFNALLKNDLTPGDDLLAVHRGQRPGLTGRALSLYTIQRMQQGTDEHFIPDNRVKQTIIDQFAVSDAEAELIRPTRYGDYSERLQFHAAWGQKASHRNRIPVVPRDGRIAARRSLLPAKIGRVAVPGFLGDAGGAVLPRPVPRAGPEHAGEEPPTVGVARTALSRCRDARLPADGRRRYPPASVGRAAACRTEGSGPHFAR